MVPTLPGKAALGALMSKAVKRLLNQGDASQNTDPGETKEQTATKVAAVPWQLLTMVAVGRTATPPPCSVMLIDGGKRDISFAEAAAISDAVWTGILLHELFPGAPLTCFS